MERIIKGFRLMVIAFVLLAVALSLPVKASFQEQVAYERFMQEKAQHILDTMFGPHMVSVSTKVQMGGESWNVRYTGRANVKTSGKPKKGDEQYNVLPGFSAIKNLSPDEATQLPWNSTVTKISPRINRVTLTMVANTALAKRDVTQAQEVLVKVLGLNQDRGDSIEVVYEKFPITTAQDDPESPMARPANNTQKYMFYLVLLFIGLYVFFQRKSLKIAKEAAEAAKQSGSGGGAAAPAKSELPDLSGLMGAAQSGGSAEDGMKRYFGFVNAGNIDAFVSVVKREKLGAQHLALVLSYLAADLKLKVLESMPVQEQATIIAQLVDERVVDSASLEKIETHIKTRLECMVGGVSATADLLAKMANGPKKQILSMIQKDAKKYAALRQTVRLFEDIGNLSEAHMKLFVSEANIDMLAASLLGADDKTRSAVESALSKSALEMVNQFRELKADNISQQEIEVAQVYVLGVAMTLERDGRIELVKSAAPKSAVEQKEA